MAKCSVCITGFPTRTSRSQIETLRLIYDLMLSIADISYFAVNPQQQGCGIGKALITHIIDYCKSQSLTIILASTAGTSPSVEAKYLLNLDRLDIACIKKLSSSINALGSSKSLHPEWWQMARFKG